MNLARCFSIATALLVSMPAPSANRHFTTISSAAAAESSGSESDSVPRIQALIPEIEAYIGAGMRAFDVPGLAIGIIANDRLVYSKGFGVRRKESGEPVETRTVFQIGSTTKGFLAATLALMVDRGKFRWDDRVVDLLPDFQFKDPWVTREFRVFDLLAQRSGLPAYANDSLGMLVGLDQAKLIRSLRYVEPVSSFRSTFAYTNLTHLIAGQIVSNAANAADWNSVLRQELLEPLGMNQSSYTAAAIEAEPNHATGHRWTPEGAIEVPFTEIFPYGFGGAGDINSSVDDLEHWVRLQLDSGTFEGRRIVSAENLMATRTPKVAFSDKLAYAVGWIVEQTPGGTIIWHNGGTGGFGSYIGLAPDKSVGVIVLTNEVNVGFPDAIGAWLFERILGNPKVDRVAEALKAATRLSDAALKPFVRPANPRSPVPAVSVQGNYANPGFGNAAVVQEGDALLLVFAATGAKLKLTPWDGDVFTFDLVPSGRFSALAGLLGPLPQGFAQFQVGKDATRKVLRLSFENGQAYDFNRE